VAQSLGFVHQHLRRQLLCLKSATLSSVNHENSGV
jgi:hypothetical protein